VRALNEALASGFPPDTNETFWRFENPQGKHAIGVGIDAPVDGRDQRPRRLLLRRHVTKQARGYSRQCRNRLSRKHDVGLVHVMGDAGQSAGDRLRRAA